MSRAVRQTDKPGFAGKLDYAQTLAILESGDEVAHLTLAENPNAPGEALYYLARHGTSKVRTAVAQNDATPVQADSILSEDEAEDVRAELARRIHRLLPHLSQGAKSQLREQAITIVQALADDQTIRVRALLADAVKNDPRIPREVALKLAHDPVFAVCGPILEYSPLLNDTDLTEIIAATRVSEALAAISRRSSVSEVVCDTLVRTGDIAAIAALLSNENAQMREDTLDLILDGAPSVESWHEPLVMRANISARAMKRIAGFVAANLVDRMIARHNVPESIARDLLLTVRRQIDSEKVGVPSLEACEQAARKAIADRIFGDKWVMEAINARNQGGTITVALGLASRLGIEPARSIIASRIGRAIMALCWKAGLSARSAYEIQQHVAHVVPNQLVPPKGGVDYPMKADQMEWLLETYIES